MRIENLFIFILCFVMSYCTSTIFSSFEDYPVELAIKAQDTCIKANSKAISFDRIQVTCENKAVIPFER